MPHYKIKRNILETFTVYAESIEEAKELLPRSEHEVIGVMAAIDMQQFGKLMKIYRQAVNLSPVEVEKRTGISQIDLSNLEEGKLKRGFASILYKLSFLYNVDYKTLCIEAGIIIKK